MAQLINIAGKKNCQGGSDVNTGKKGCTIELSALKHLIKMPSSFVIPKEQDFDLDYIKQQVQKGIFVPILGASYFADVSSEDAYNTNPAGEKRLNVDALAEYRLTFEEGHEFYKQMTKLRGYKDSAFALGDDKGNWALAKNSDGDYKGFQAGHVTPEIRKPKVQGGDSEMRSLLVQFINRNEWDEEYDIFLHDELGWLSEDIPTVNGVSLSFNAIPADGDTVLDLNAVLTADKQTAVEGLEVDDFKVRVNGEDVVISNLAEPTEGNYQLTIPALSEDDVVEVYFYDTALSANVIDDENILYRSNVLSDVALAA